DATLLLLLGHLRELVQRPADLVRPHPLKHLGLEPDVVPARLAQLPRRQERRLLDVLGNAGAGVAEVGQREDKRSGGGLRHGLVRFGVTAWAYSTGTFTHFRNGVAVVRLRGTRDRELIRTLVAPGTGSERAASASENGEPLSPRRGQARWGARLPRSFRTSSDHHSPKPGANGIVSNLSLSRTSTNRVKESSQCVHWFDSPY